MFICCIVISSYSYLHCNLQDKKPAFSCSVESNHVKDMIWIKDMESSFILLTNSGELHLGAINNSPKHVMDQVDAGECLVLILWSLYLHKHRKSLLVLSFMNL